MRLYDKKKFSKLRHHFPGAEKIDKNYSQAYQDMFVLTMLNGKNGGTYVDIGAFEPEFISNTYLLEKKFDWKGISVEIDPDLVKRFQQKRKNPIIGSDALAVDYASVFKQNNFNSQIDYLSIDIEPKTQTLACLKKLPMNDYRFSVITFETDYYDNSEGRKVAEEVREESRKILFDLGYELIGGNMANTGPNDPLEDWWVDPRVVDRALIQKFKYRNPNLKEKLTFTVTQYPEDFNQASEHLLITE